MSAGIIAVGAYVPRARLQRSAIFRANAWFADGLKGLTKGERAIANWDEDSLTMAVEAARDALGETDRTTVGAVAFASTTHPFADRSNAGVVREALTLPEQGRVQDLSGSLRAGTSGLIAALQGTGGDGRSALVVASDLRKTQPASEAELNYGDAAAAVLVGEGDVIADFVGAYSVNADFIASFRAAHSDFDYQWEGRWVRDAGYIGLVGDAMRDALAHFGLAASDVDRLLVPITARGIAESLAKRCGIDAGAVADRLSAAVGDSGTAHPLLMLADALEQAGPGELILLLGFGQGVDVIALRTTDAIAKENHRPRRVSRALARRTVDENYMRWLAHRGIVQLDLGMRAELDQKQPGSTLWRNRKAVLGLVGGRCTETGTVQFPKSDVSVSPNRPAAHTQEDYPLAERRAQVVSYTADKLTFSLNPPTYYGMIDFEGGGRMTVEFADTLPGEVEVGRDVRMAFRIKAHDQMRGFTKYFWKAVPVSKEDEHAARD